MPARKPKASKVPPSGCPRCGRIEDAVPATNYGRPTGGWQFRCCNITTWPMNFNPDRPTAIERTGRYEPFLRAAKAPRVRKVDTKAAKVTTERMQAAAVRGDLVQLVDASEAYRALILGRSQVPDFVVDACRCGAWFIRPLNEAIDCPACLAVTASDAEKLHADAEEHGAKVEELEEKIEKLEEQVSGAASVAVEQALHEVITRLRTLPENTPIPDVIQLLDALTSSIPSDEQRVEIWSKPYPHFGGSSPHRYDGGDHCVYCNRPKKWKPDAAARRQEGTTTP